MTELPPETVNAAQARVSDILKPNGASDPGMAVLHVPAESAVSRKERTDKGVPRLYVEIPGVRFDVGTEDGRKAIKAWIAQQGAEPCVDDIFDGLLAIIDRLRGAK